MVSQGGPSPGKKDLEEKIDKENKDYDAIKEKIDLEDEIKNHTEMLDKELNNNKNELDKNERKTSWANTRVKLHSQVHFG